ncbi:neuronal pentraxin-2-like [Orbicella faveolata]|uniref:neuronal pentraxin-2-like n=1 Tax=Orbicella faveolata TaxID=48498 RepID=UPI0009E2131A|nr:neuronal pentraxin-2-like [Orbicella faveolata]
MASGESNFLVYSVLLLCLLGFASTAAASDSKVGSVEKKKVFITGQRIEVIISSTKEDTNVSLKQILQKLESMNAETKKLVKDVQALKRQIHTLDDKVGNALLFPRRGKSDYVIIRGSMPNLSALTACLWMKAADTNIGTPLGYAVSDQDNEFIIYNYKSFMLFVGGSYRETYVSAIDGKWHHICATWENMAGSWKLYKDGAVADQGQGLQKGYVIRGAGSLVLGQEQDSGAGRFNALQSFVGEMTGVNIWNRVIDHHEIVSMSKSCRAGEGNVYKWSDFKPHIIGGVQLVSLSCAI